VSQPIPARSRTLWAAATKITVCALLLVPLGDVPGRPGPFPQASGISNNVELQYFVLKAAAGDKSKVTENPDGGLSAGDQIALRVEPIHSGHLYIFFLADGASPAMIYPNLERPASEVKRDTSIEIPSSQSQMSQWWEVRDGAGTDRFYVVLSREPLRNVPVGEALVKHCATIQGRCYWKPPTPLWESIVAQARAGVLSTDPPRKLVPDRRPPLTLVASSMAVAVVETKIRWSSQ
jgi:hypothetical protein